METVRAEDKKDELKLDDGEKKLLEDLNAVIAEHEDEAVKTVDRESVGRAFEFSCRKHHDQKRKSGEDFIVHPLGVAKICAGMRLDTQTICASLLHDTVEDTSATLKEVSKEFGEEIAQLVDGVTKLAGMTFKSRDEHQAENFRKMMVAMASDIRVILIKMADRLHNMRTLDALTSQKKIDKSKETLEIYAPLAHRLGIHAIKWELEDLAFTTLHPRKYKEIKSLVNQQREEREVFINKAAEYLLRELSETDVEADISGRAKHFYSIYAKMAKKGREFNEIYDLTAMRVLVNSVSDCYAVVGVVHSLWKPLPGRFKDFIAMPKANMYQSLHTTVIGPEGRPLEIQIRTEEMHKLAEFGVAAHWIYKDPKKYAKNLVSKSDDNMPWLKHMLEWQQDLTDPKEFMETLKVDLFEDEVFVFTPQGEVKSLPSGSTPLDFAYAVHTDVGHRCVGANVNGTLVPLHYQLRSGDIVEIQTAKQERGPSRDWLEMVKTTSARNKIRAWFKRERREDSENLGREMFRKELRKQSIPARNVSGSPLLADVIREMGFRKADDFYIAMGQAKISSKVVVGKIMQRLTAGQAVTEDAPSQELIDGGTDSLRVTRDSDLYGIDVDGVDRVEVRLAKCCRPVPGDTIVGYVSLGRGITIHRKDCGNVKSLKRNADRFTKVSWKGESHASFRVELRVDGWDRSHLLEDLSRTVNESGANIIEARCMVEAPMVKNWFVVELGDTATLKTCVSRLRNVEGVFDAYRVTPSSAD